MQLTGKSTLLDILLILRLHAKLPTILQVAANEIFLFDKTGVQRVDALNIGDILNFRGLHSSASTTMHVWALIDSNLDLKGVPSIYFLNDFFVVQTPSPRAGHFDWTKKLSTEPARFILKQWSLTELILG